MKRLTVVLAVVALMLPVEAAWSVSASFFEVKTAEAFRKGKLDDVVAAEPGRLMLAREKVDLLKAEGEIVWSFDWSTLGGDDPHEPEILPDDHLLICLQHETPHQVVEIDRATGEQCR